MKTLTTYVSIALFTAASYAIPAVTPMGAINTIQLTVDGQEYSCTKKPSPLDAYVIRNTPSVAPAKTHKVRSHAQKKLAEMDLGELMDAVQNCYEKNVMTFSTACAKEIVACEEKDRHSNPYHRRNDLVKSQACEPYPIP